MAGSAHRSLDGRRAAADQLAHRDRHLGRVVADLAGRTDQLDGLRRIGIDEIAHRKGHRYLSVVVDHDTGRLVWAAAGRDTATLHRFFDALGEARSAQLSHVSADGAEWIHTVAAEGAPRRPSAWTPSTSWPGPPRHSTSSAATCGTTCAAPSRRPGSGAEEHPVGAGAQEE